MLTVMNKSSAAIEAPHRQGAAALVEAQPVLAQRLARHCAPDEAVDLLAEVLRFLELVAHADGRLTPSEVVDRAWHEFILCTRTYSAYCQKRFGRYIHHEPGGPKAANRRQFNQTLRLYQSRFGPPPARWWAGGDCPCGACDAN